MKYVSTRGGMTPQPFSAILLEGLASDGGLAVPEAYPHVDRVALDALRPLSYRDIAFEVIRVFADDIPAEDLRAIVDETYTAENFGSDEITPLAKLGEGVSLLKLSEGPTLAFKDIAMQLLGRLFEYALKKNRGQLNILGATSGDTGSAAEYAMRGRERIRVFMLSPFGKMSPFQTAQMYALQDANVINLAVRGVFDDCQDVVKAVSGDNAFKRKLSIGTVNSINWARIVAQVVYYFKGYFAATKSNDEQVSFAVPSGNFGNILAGHIARSMGLPIKRLVLATNENDVLDEFFKTGIYRVRRTADVIKTSSPSMDISKASNFERYMFDVAGRSAEVVRSLWRDLESLGRFDISDTPTMAGIEASGFVSGRSVHADRLATIRDVYARHRIIVDPHTADGIKVAREHVETGVPMICLETAQPAKFAETIHEALGIEPPRLKGFEGIEAKPQRYRVIDADTETVKDIIRDTAAAATENGRRVA